MSTILVKSLLDDKASNTNNYRKQLSLLKEFLMEEIKEENYNSFFEHSHIHECSIRPYSSCLLLNKDNTTLSSSYFFNEENCFYAYLFPINNEANRKKRLENDDKGYYDQVYQSCPKVLFYKTDDHSLLLNNPIFRKKLITSECDHYAIENYTAPLFVDIFDDKDIVTSSDIPSNLNLDRPTSETIFEDSLLILTNSKLNKYLCHYNYSSVFNLLYFEFH